MAIWTKIISKDIHIMLLSFQMSYWKNSRRWSEYKNRKRLSRKYSYYHCIYGANQEQRKELIAPKNFSIIYSPSTVISFLSEIVERAYHKEYILVNLSSIASIDLPTISILISIMMDKRPSGDSVRKYVRFRMPKKNSEPSRIFSESQFYETVTNNGNANRTFFLSRQGTKITEDNKKDIINQIKMLAGADKASGLNGLLEEILSNTRDHATPPNEKIEIPWFISIMQDVNDENIVNIAAVDLGLGICKSLYNHNRNTFSQNNPLNPIDKIYDNQQSLYLRKSIPQGVFSTTGKPYRGNGLKTIYSYMNSHRFVKEAFLVTNKAYVNLLKIDSPTPDSDSSFDGTMIYWRIRK